MTSETASYFTFVGSHDPQPTPDGAQGPALDLLDALRTDGLAFSEVVVAWTPGTASEGWPGGYDEQKAALLRQVQGRLPGAQVREVPVRVRPNVAADLVPVVATALDRYRHAGRVLHVNASSGTPQMLEALKLLRGTGWFAEGDVTLWQVDRPKHREPGVAHHREATTPFLEEALRLAGAFAALRRFDFAGAREEFDALAGGPLELPQRTQSVAALGDVAEALRLLDMRDFVGAREVLDELTLHVPPLDALRELVSDGAGQDADALVWLTWGRYGRAAEQERVADALIWATILQEVMVVQLSYLHGVYAKEWLTRGTVSDILFDALKREAPSLIKGDKLKAKDLKQKLTLLRAPSLQVANVEVFDANTNTHLEQVRQWRNDVVHDGQTLDDAKLTQVDDVVRGLLAAFPFRTEKARGWVSKPEDCPVSAVSLAHMISALESWLG